MDHAVRSFGFPEGSSSKACALTLTRGVFLAVGMVATDVSTGRYVCQLVRQFPDLQNKME